MTNAEKLIEFIQKSPVSFFAVENIAQKLLKNGFTELRENEIWKAESGKNYFVRRNNSSVIAFKIPSVKYDRMLVVSSHSDSPSFKIKENPEIKAEGNYVKLNIEKYGGMLCAPWFDRPLSVAGRFLLKTESPLEFEEKLVDADSDLLIIPSLAIHMNRESGSESKFNVQNDMLPVFSCTPDKKLMDVVAEKAGVKVTDIAGSDLFLYCRTSGTILGADGSLIASPRLDDLECAWTSLEAFVESENKKALCVYCCFDNEEVGSLTRQGADSTFFYEVMERLNGCLGRTHEEFLIAADNGFMISADNAHGVHPNYSSYADPVNRPVLNKGPVLKFNGNQKYTTDGISSAMFRSLCEKAGVPCQVYTNRSDIPGGSTLGNLSNAHISIKCADIGLAQWSMHSPYETAGTMDVDYMIVVLKEFYSAE